MFRKLRILVLTIILASVALSAWRANTRLTEWKHSVHVAIYPIAADDSPATRQFVGQIEAGDFIELGEWLQEESNRYGQTVLQPLVTHLAAPLAELPPLPPQGGSALETIWWSLQLRWWASRHDAIAGPKPNVRLFVLYHDPAQADRLPHSTGLDKGQIGLIHAFAARGQRRQNLVVIAHELLHTFGASDKYDRATLQPIFPAGYAEPEKTPRLPQTFAEIMAGRTPIDEGRADIPDRLTDTLIGPATAREIGLQPKLR